MRRKEIEEKRRPKKSVDILSLPASLTLFAEERERKELEEREREKSERKESLRVLRCPFIWAEASGGKKRAQTF
jgi:hypothetical protein